MTKINEQQNRNKSIDTGNRLTAIGGGGETE